MKSAWEKWLREYRGRRELLPEEQELLKLLASSVETEDYLSNCCPHCQALEPEALRMFTDERTGEDYHRCQSCDRGYGEPERRNLLDEVLMAGDAEESDFVKAFPNFEYPFVAMPFNNPQPHVQAAVYALRNLAREVVLLRVKLAGKPLSSAIGEVA